MPRRFNRAERINDLIQTALADILQHQTKDLNLGMVTVTGVSVSPDYSYAKVFVSVLLDDQANETVAALNRVAKAIRYELASAVKLRITPELKFVYDDSAVRGQRISSLINNALKDK